MVVCCVLSSLVQPDAIAFQKRQRFSRCQLGGLPGEHNLVRVHRWERRFFDLIATSLFKMLQSPLELALNAAVGMMHQAAFTLRRDKAISSAAIVSCAASVRSRAQPITRREKASRTTARYTNSVSSRIYVMSAIQSWLMLVSFISPARLGYTRKPCRE